MTWMMMGFVVSERRLPRAHARKIRAAPALVRATTFRCGWALRKRGVRVMEDEPENLN